MLSLMLLGSHLHCVPPIDGLQSNRRMVSFFEKHWLVPLRWRVALSVALGALAASVLLLLLSGLHTLLAEKDGSTGIEEAYTPPPLGSCLVRGGILGGVAFSITWAGFVLKEASAWGSVRQARFLQRYLSGTSRKGNAWAWVFYTLRCVTLSHSAGLTTRGVMAERTQIINKYIDASREEDFDSSEKNTNTHCQALNRAWLGGRDGGDACRGGFADPEVALAVVGNAADLKIYTLVSAVTGFACAAAAGILFCSALSR